MQTPSSLSQLSHAEKHALILMLSEQITALQESVKQVQSRPNTHSGNSSKPPSSDVLNKPASKFLRVAGQVFDPKNRSYPAPARAGGGCGKTVWRVICSQM
jgi:Family of unknown function (DUF6444)